MAQRVRKILSNDPAPEPVVYDGGDWHRGDEFLKFTKDTAPSWGGPFEFQGHLGCIAKLHEQAVRPFPLRKVEEDWSEYMLPYKYKALAPERLYYMTPEQKEAEFAKLPLEAQLAVAQDYVKRRADGHYFNECLPFRLYLAGNDDTSYSKYFVTREEAEKELNYLRKMQPLDFGRDILSRQYFFTN